MKKVFFVTLFLTFFFQNSLSQSKWSITLKIDSLNTQYVVPIDANKSFVRVWWYRNGVGEFYWMKNSSSDLDWQREAFIGVDTIAGDQSTPSLQVSAPNRIYGYLSGNGPLSGIILSKDSAKTWELLNSVPTAPKLTRASNSFTVTENNRALYIGQDTFLRVSSDGCKTFTAKNDDTTFKNNIGRYSVNGGGFAPYDFIHWTYALYDYGTPINEPGLSTLVSVDDLKTWSKYNYKISSNEDKSVYGNLQSIKGTSNVFYILGHNGGSSAHASSPFDVRLGVSFLFSSDYGKSWTPNYSFGHRRRGFYAISDKEIWMTVSSKDTLYYNGIADWIVHSIDGGATWDIDSTTLNIQDVGKFDGKYLAFYDKGHGWLSAMANGNGYVFRFTDTSKTSVEKIEHSLDYVRQVFKIYPNPSNEKVNLLVGADKKILSIRLYDILGKEYIPSYTLTKTNEAVVDLQSIPSGVYLVKLQNQYQYYTLPMVVTKTN
jgi:hypothetical protein